MLLPQLTLNQPASQPLPSPLSNKVRLEYHVVYRIYSALLNTHIVDISHGHSTWDHKLTQWVHGLTLGAYGHLMGTDPPTRLEFDPSS